MERPILFSTEMVKAILAGWKTQTRRVIKPQPPEDVTEIVGPTVYEPAKVDRYGELVPGEPVYGVYDKWGEWGAKCPYGQPGDILWVREAWCEAGVFGYAYRATEDLPAGVRTGWRPAIHMPREAARLFLRVKNVRVERVQDITEEDAKAEGVEFWDAELYRKSDGCFYSASELSPVDRFHALWDRLNAKRGYGWQANPWVWVIEFEVMAK